METAPNRAAGETTNVRHPVSGWVGLGWGAQLGSLGEDVSLQPVVFLGRCPTPMGSWLTLTGPRMGPRMGSKMQAGR